MLYKLDSRNRNILTQMITKAAPDSLAQLLYCHFIFVVKPPFKDNFKNWAISKNSHRIRGLPEARLIKVKLRTLCALSHCDTQPG